MDDQAQPAAEPALSPLAQALTQIPIEAVDEKFLLPRSSAELEEFLTYVHIMLLALKGKAEIAHKILEFRQTCMDKARKYIKLTGPEIDALINICPEEEQAEIRRALLELVNGPTLAEKPPTQNLGGSFITRDVDQEVKPGGSAQTPGQAQA